MRATLGRFLTFALAVVPVACLPPAVTSDRDETIPIPQGA